MAGPSSTVDQNLLPVQAYFDVYGNFQTFIGQGQPFYATINPIQSGLTITNSTINSTTIGATSPSTGVFTNVSATTGQISTSPTNATDIANKFYVDTVAQGLGPKAACAVATTANITLSGLQTIDGYTTLAGDRVLVKNQGSSQFNGIYIASASTWTRSADMDVWAEVPGAYTVILNGGQSDTGWVCTATQTGTINVTAMPWVQFSGTNTYYAGTGLTLASNTFSITPVGTAGTYGSASAVPVFVTNASGQVTSVTNTSIAINANQITSGTIASSLISGSYTGITGVGTLTAGTWNATPITNTYLANSSITINGNLVSLGGSTTVTANTTNSVTFNSSGSGGASPISFNGSASQTISYNTIGAPSTTGTNASGTWGISISGNAATVTNGVYTTGSYSNPAWIISILGSIVSGAVANATLAASATNVAGGTTGSLVYQTGAGATSFLGLGTTNYVLTAGATAPQYVAQSTLSVGSASTATTSTNLAGGVAGAIPWQSAPSTTGFTAAGTTGQVLTSGGTGVPTWTTPVSNATVTDDTTTNGTRYPLFANQTSGSLTTEYTSSTKLQYNPSTGVFTSTQFSGSGAGLTSIPNSALTNSSITIGSTAISLGGTATTIAGLTSVTSTTFVGALTGNASSATTATTATNATNIAITDNTSSVSTYYPVLSVATTGNNPATTSSTKLSFVPSTGVLSANGVALTGNLGTVTSVAALTLGTSGTDLSSSVATGTTTPVITLNVPTASATNRGALSAADWTTFNNKGSGSVTSVAQSFTGGIISVSGSPITTSGTLALTVAGTSGGIPYFTSTTTWASSALLAANALMVGGGAGVAPSTITTGTGVVTALGVNTSSAGAFVVNGGVLGTPSSGTVTNLTGTASININGTVGATTATTGAFTTISATGVITSTLATGTAPFTVASTTQVANLNAATAGSATTATNATNVAVADASTNANYYPTFVAATGSNQPLKTASSTLKYNPSTGALSTGSIIYIAP